MFETTVGDQCDPAELCLIAIGLGSPVAAAGAVPGGVGFVTTVGARPVRALMGPGDRDLADIGDDGAAAPAEPVGVTSRCGAPGAGGPFGSHTWASAVTSVDAQ